MAEDNNNNIIITTIIKHRNWNRIQADLDYFALIGLECRCHLIFGSCHDLTQ